MYSVTRIPDENCDYWVNYGISRHFVALCRGNFYKIDICDKHGNIYTVDQLTKLAITFFRLTIYAEFLLIFWHDPRTRTNAWAGFALLHTTLETNGLGIEKNSSWRIPSIKELLK